LSVTHEELVLLQAQMEGLESIFFELYPFGIELKRQQVQDYYNQRFNSVTQAQVSVARGELRRNFNTRANQVRNLVDSAESIGDVTNKLNLIIAAACLPHERNRTFDPSIMTFCENLIFHNKIEGDILDKLLGSIPLKGSEARLLLACTMFCGSIQINKDGTAISIQELLANIITIAKTKDLLPRNDPFYTEALYFLEGMSDENAIYK
jgi:hypothetical protein